MTEPSDLTMDALNDLFRSVASAEPPSELRVSRELGDKLVESGHYSEETDADGTRFLIKRE